jgi:hypothetical protein
MHPTVTETTQAARRSAIRASLPCTSTVTETAQAAGRWAIRASVPSTSTVRCVAGGFA